MLATPKALEGLKKLCKNDCLGRVVIDEAHYLADCDPESSSGGREKFREAYRELGTLIRRELQQWVLCLTASMSKDVVHTLMDDLQLNVREDIFLSAPPSAHLSTHIIEVLPRLFHTAKNGVDDLADVVPTICDDVLVTHWRAARSVCLWPCNLINGSRRARAWCSVSPSTTRSVSLQPFAKTESPPITSIRGYQKKSKQR